jgi:murein DD-endopeptidase MepM/ murein hydrolase activator NlpD
VRPLLALAGLAGAATGVILATRSPAESTRQPPACDGFDFPVGAPDAEGYYDAQKFGENDHLGADWNGNGGNDTDLGDAVFAVSAGIVVEARDMGGDWGNVVRIVHACSGVESLYAHLDTIGVDAGTWIARGRQIGTIGNAGGRYRAHLHFEIRERIGMPLGGGYSSNRGGYVDPTWYIRTHRAR